MNKLILLLPIVLLMACINLTVGVPAVCDTLALGTVPGSPVANITLPPTSFSSKMDFSGAVSGLDSISNTVKADISQLTINNAGDLSWISEVDVSISTDSMPSAPLGKYASNGKSNSELVIPISMDTQTLLTYLKNPITLTFTINGTAPTQSIVLDNTMCVAVSGNIKK